MSEMSSSRPYLLRALYEWIVDNGLTPLMLMDAEHQGVMVPPDFVEDGKIILNAAPGAVRNLEMNNEFITFGARFSGKPFVIQAPITAVLAIYARENGRGMMFAEDHGDDSGPPRGGGGNDGKKTMPPGDSRPKLRVIK